MEEGVMDTGQGTAMSTGQQEAGMRSGAMSTGQQEAGMRSGAMSTGRQEAGMRSGAVSTGQQEAGMRNDAVEAGRQVGGMRSGAIHTEQQAALENGCTGGLLEEILENFPGKRQDVRAYSPLALAYIGDAVYDLIIRTVVVARANRPAMELHRITVKYVSANAQSEIVQGLTEMLTEEEKTIYRRGKNSKPHTTAKNASPADYMKATGFEAVIGYLYLTGRMDRALELVRKGLELAGMRI